MAGFGAGEGTEAWVVQGTRDICPGRSRMSPAVTVCRKENQEPAGAEAAGSGSYGQWRF